MGGGDHRPLGCVGLGRTARPGRGSGTAVQILPHRLGHGLLVELGQRFLQPPLGGGFFFLQIKLQNPVTGKSKTHLRFEDVDKPAPTSKLAHTVKAAPLTAASAQAHRKIQEVEQENVGVESVHRLEEVSEGGVRLAAHSRRAQKLKPYREAEKARMHLYASYMATLGNRPDLFPITEYPNASQRENYLDYDVPPEALEDEVFAAMLKEAEKYLGFPYVWGGTNPSTSFDCSGYVSWVINHSGWNYGRLGVMGLEDVCTPVSRANAKPGDLVFFIGTYDAPYPDRPSHVGIYVGNGMMIHCGSPISYANINTPYWQNHFYGFGRLREP